MALPSSSCGACPDRAAPRSALLRGAPAGGPRRTGLLGALVRTNRNPWCYRMYAGAVDMGIYPDLENF